MIHTVSPSHAAKIDAAVQEQFGHLQEGLVQAGFLKGMVGNMQAWEKIADSFAGNAVNVAFYAVAKQVVLFICRTYDQSGNSLPYLCRLLKDAVPHIESKRRTENPDWPAHKLELGRVAEFIDNLDAKIAEVQAGDAYTSVRRLRNEHVAHLLEGRSDISQRLARDSKSLDNATFDQILGLAETAATQIVEARRIWTFEVYVWRMLLKQYEEHTRSFFELIPDLRGAERLSSRQRSLQRDT